MKIVLKSKGRVLSSGSEEARNEIIRELATKMSESLRYEVHKNFERDVQLTAIAGQMSDQDVVRAILRSLIVNIRSLDPISLEAKFEDYLAHWYKTEEGLPKELSDKMQQLLNDSIKKWFSVGKPKEILAEVLNK